MSASQNQKGLQLYSRYHDHPAHGQSNHQASPEVATSSTTTTTTAPTTASQQPVPNKPIFPTVTSNNNKKWKPRYWRQSAKPTLTSTSASAPAIPTPSFAPKRPAHKHQNYHRQNQSRNQGNQGKQEGGGPGSFRIVDKIQFDRPCLPVDQAEMDADAARLGLTVGLKHSRWAMSGDGDGEVDKKSDFLVVHEDIYTWTSLHEHVLNLWIEIGTTLEAKTIFERLVPKAAIQYSL
ncbi:hypothetical protein F4775DRAFT_591990 [Biscogniauxia sp. FL1348]|nr:hypothetical protein F4775DRAFT_591990 [Biscogniauxia sp. FL1348]